MLDNDKEYEIVNHITEKIDPIQFILNDMHPDNYVYDFIAQKPPFVYMETINLEKNTDTKVDEYIETVLKKYKQFEEDNA